MANFNELRALIDKAEEACRERADCKMMITRAWGVILDIQKTDKNIPSWMSKKLEKLKEALTYEPRD